MATLRHIRAWVAAHPGADLDELGPANFTVVAPRGHVFVASDCHSVAACAWDDDRPADVRRALIGRPGPRAQAVR